MSATNLTARDIQELVRKLDLVNLRQTKETFAEYWLDGVYQFRVKMPNIHGGNKTVSSGLLRACADSVGLNLREYADLVNCPMTPEEFARRVRETALLRRPG